MDFGNVRLVGMTREDLQAAYKLRFDDTGRLIYVLPDDIIQNTVAAYNVTATSETGYSGSYGVPTGRYIAPANSGGCIQIVTGDCAPTSTYVRAAPWWNFDLSIVKQIRFTETKNFELRGEFLNAFNHPNFSFVANPGSSQNWGQVSSVNGTPDSRTVQVVMRINF